MRNQKTSGPLCYVGRWLYDMCTQSTHLDLRGLELMASEGDHTTWAPQSHTPVPLDNFAGSTDILPGGGGAGGTSVGHQGHLESTLGPQDLPFTWPPTTLSLGPQTPLLTRAPDSSRVKRKHMRGSTGPLANGQKT